MFDIGSQLLSCFILIRHLNWCDSELWLLEKRQGLIVVFQILVEVLVADTVGVVQSKLASVADVWIWLGECARHSKIWLWTAAISI